LNTHRKKYMTAMGGVWSDECNRGIWYHSDSKAMRQRGSGNRVKPKAVKRAKESQKRSGTESATKVTSKRSRKQGRTKPSINKKEREEAEESKRGCDPVQTSSRRTGGRSEQGSRKTVGLVLATHTTTKKGERETRPQKKNFVLTVKKRRKKVGQRKH